MDRHKKIRETKEHVIKIAIGESEINRSKGNQTLTRILKKNPYCMLTVWKNV